MRSLVLFLARFLTPAFGGGPSMPSPAAVPTNPADDSAARKARDDAASAAQAEALAGGRRATMVSGLKDSEENIQDNTLGGPRARTRSAAKSLGY